MDSGEVSQVGWNGGGGQVGWNRGDQLGWDGGGGLLNSKFLI